MKFGEVWISNYSLSIKSVIFENKAQINNADGYRHQKTNLDNKKMNTNYN